MDIPLRYGRRGLIARLPDENVRHVLRLNPAPPLPDVTAATRHALRQPLGAKPLRELAAGRGKVCLVLPDNTRPLPCKTLLPPILEELARAGVGPERILLLIATGEAKASKARQAQSRVKRLAIPRATPAWGAPAGAPHFG